MTKLKEYLESEEYLEGFTFYGVLGNNIIIFKTKGKYVPDQKSKPILSESFRKHQNEFGGCALFGSLCRTALGGLHLMADINVTSVLIGMGKNIMKFDTQSELGKRSLLVSNHKKLLEDLMFNRPLLFDTVFRVIPVVKLERENLKAVISLPGINTEKDVYNSKRHPFFRIIVAMGSVPDIIYNSTSETYEPL